MKKLIWLVVVIIVLIIAVILLPDSNSGMTNSNGGKDKGPIKIGFIGPLTGDAATVGVSSKAAVEIAAEEINAVGGINGRMIEMVYEDGKCGSAAASAAQKLMNVDMVFMIIGGLCSGETASFAKQAMDQKVPVFSYLSSSPALSTTGKYFFRDYPSDAFQGKFAAEYLYNRLGARKVAVLYHVSDWGTGITQVFEKSFKELGGEIIASEGAQQTSRDYRTELSKIKSLNPDYLYAPLYTEGAIVAVGQMKELGLKIKVFGADGWADTKLQKETSGKADVLYAEVKTGSNPDFLKKLMTKSGQEQSPIGAAQAYDALMLSAQVLKKTGTNPDTFATELHKQDYTGISGQIRFDENGDLKDGGYVVKRVERGTAVEVK